MAENADFSRAEAVRARRAKRLQREQSPRKAVAAGRSVERTAHHAPIVMRGISTDVPIQRKKLSRVRRRYDISLGSPGAEMRLPPVPVMRPSWRWLSGVLALGLLALLFAMWNFPVFLVQTIEIQGLQRLDARELHLVLGIQNESIFSLDPAALTFELGSAFPEFEDIEVSIGMPNLVTISVHERLPVIGWVNSQGMVLVDKDGISFPARGVVYGNAENQTFPVVEAPDLVMRPPDPEKAEAAAQQGYILNPYVNRELLKPHQVEAIVGMSQIVPANAKIVYDPRHGMGWKDPAGWVVYFGLDGTDMQARMQMYEAIVEDLRSRNVTPAFISVEFLHAPYYRMER